MNLIVIEHATRHFGDAPRPAVDDVSLTAPAGAFVTLLGPSGCGKTTLLKMINRLYPLTAGRILIDGQDTVTIPATTLRRHIGYVIQHTGLFPLLRIADNIATVPRLLGWKRARIDERVDELLTLVGLPVAYRSRFPRQPSGAEQQRVGVARALAADPAIVLMDEPFSAIDAITRTRLQDELLQIQTRLQKTILFVTHDVEEAFKLGERIVVMREGRVVQEGTPLELVAAPADAFVRDLIGAGDMLRRLSLLPVGAAALRPLDGGTDRTRIGQKENLRRALGLLLASDARSLAVVDEDGTPVGLLDFTAIRSTLAPIPDGRDS